MMHFSSTFYVFNLQVRGAIQPTQSIQTELLYILRITPGRMECITGARIRTIFTFIVKGKLYYIYKK